MRLLRAPVVLALAALLAGCSISAGPVRVEDRPNDLALGDKETTPVSLERPDHLRDPADLVSRFLAAAAEQEDRPGTLRTYLADKSDSWNPGEKINVVRILDGPVAGPLQRDGSYLVKVVIQRIGELVDGRIAPAEWEPQELTFSVVPVEGKGLFLDTPPSTELFLPEESLTTRYEDRLLHFRTADERLVTDLRYVPRYLTEEEKADRLVHWLFDGPAPWLAQAVDKLPPAARPTSAVVADKQDKLVVNLAAPLPENERDQIAEQLYRTLVVSPVAGLDIKIQGQPLLYTKPATTERYAPGRYAIVDGVVVRLRVTHRGDDQLRVPAEFNKDVVAVAFSRGEEAVALVRRLGNTTTLWVGPVGAPRQVTLPGNPKQISQPLWLDQRSKQLLVLGDGKLYQVVLGGAASLVQGVNNVEAMTVAPDGHRLALVTEGKLRIAALIRPLEGQISVGTTQPVPTRFARVHQVAFGKKHDLVIAGSGGGETQIAVMNLDGSLQASKGETRSSSVLFSRLVADPQSGAVLYEIRDDTSYELFETGSELLWHSVIRLGSPAEVRVSAPSFEG